MHCAMSNFTCIFFALVVLNLQINNAGSNAYTYKPLVETSDEALMEIITTNTLGLMICCREAINMMRNQPRGDHIFNLDGASSDRRPTPRFAAYGATKQNVVCLTKSLQAELQMNELNNVMVHNLSPGMVTIDLLMSGATTKQIILSLILLHRKYKVAIKHASAISLLQLRMLLAGYSTNAPPQALQVLDTVACGVVFCECASSSANATAWNYVQIHQGWLIVGKGWYAGGRGMEWALSEHQADAEWLVFACKSDVTSLLKLGLTALLHKFRVFHGIPLCFHDR